MAARQQGGGSNGYVSKPQGNPTAVKSYLNSQKRIFEVAGEDYLDFIKDYTWAQDHQADLKEKQRLAMIVSAAGGVVKSQHKEGGDQRNSKAVENQKKYLPNAKQSNTENSQQLCNNSYNRNVNTGKQNNTANYQVAGHNVNASRYTSLSNSGTATIIDSWPSNQQSTSNNNNKSGSSFANVKVAISQLQYGNVAKYPAKNIVIPFIPDEDDDDDDEEDDRDIINMISKNVQKPPVKAQFNANPMNSINASINFLNQMEEEDDDQDGEKEEESDDNDIINIANSIKQQFSVKTIPTYGLGHAKNHHGALNLNRSEAPDNQSFNKLKFAMKK